MTPTTPQPFFVPTPEQVERSRITELLRHLKATRGLDLPDFDALWHWSVTDLEGFWAALWEHFGLDRLSGYEQVLASEAMPGAQWFTGARLNMAGYLLAQGEGRDQDTAVVGLDEAGGRHTWTWAQLRAEVAAFARTLREMGVGPGDVVAGYLPNLGETAIAFLATASVGATWSAVGQDYAPTAAVDRFAQLEPVVLVTADGYHWNGSFHDRRPDLAALIQGLPTVRHTVLVARDQTPTTAMVLPTGWRSWADTIAVAAPLETLDVPFDHPLWVLFSSGTTGLPKGLVHGHGGVLLELLKNLALHLDQGRDDKLFWYTSPSWVMWNLQVSALAVGASIVCYDGAPTHPDPSALWRVVAQERVTFLGISPGFLQACENAGLVPRTAFDLSVLRAMGSTGAPLPAHSFRWVSEQVASVPLWSLSGGTDVASAFVSGAPTVPVWPGEISVRGLGVAVEAWDEQGHPLVGQVGELVITRPIPSMPLRLWGDADGSRYADSYFSTYPGVWRQGDWITITERGSVIIHGRSDATLNRNGVRMGSADIYAAVETHPQVVEALVVGVELPEGGYWMPLFVALEEGAMLTDELVGELREAIRRRASPRHVPDEVLQVPGIPHTRTGKKLEVPVKRLLQGAALDQVAQADAVDHPELLAAYAAIAASRHPR